MQTGTLQQLNLSESDFDLMVEALDALPNKRLAGEIMSELFMSIVSDKSNPDEMDKIKNEREVRRKEAEKQKSFQQENIKILQGKLLMLKRYLREQSALNEATEIISFGGR